MKKVFLICFSLVLFAGKSVAQHASVALSDKELKQRMALNAPYFYDKYKTGSTLKSAGIGMTIGGVALGIIGATIADKETITEGGTTTVNLSGPGAAVFGVGIVSAVAGTPLWIIGGTKKKNARNTYLREFGYSMYMPTQPSPYLQLTSSPNSIGLALVF